MSSASQKLWNPWKLNPYSFLNLTPFHSILLFSPLFYILFISVLPFPIQSLSSLYLKLSLLFSCPTPSLTRVMFKSECKLFHPLVASWIIDTLPSAHSVSDEPQIGCHSKKVKTSRSLFWLFRKLPNTNFRHTRPAPKESSPRANNEMSE